MKKKLQKCLQCNEETWHMEGKKQAHDGERHYNRRTTSECVVCGRKEINNRTKGKRIVLRGNATSNINNTKSKENSK